MDALTHIVQAPEFYKNGGQLCFETDIYALGMVRVLLVRSNVGHIFTKYFMF